MWAEFYLKQAVGCTIGGGEVESGGLQENPEVNLAQ